MTRYRSLQSGRTSRRAALKLLAGGGALALLAACQGAAPQAPAPSGATQAPAKAVAPTTPAPAAATGGALNVALSDLGNQNLDVILASTNNNVIPIIYERLLSYNEKGELIPWLAESWKMSPDGRLWTFNLRKDVKFSNGDQMTSADVKFSFERYIAEAARSAWSPMHRQTVDSIETPDQYTVLVHAKSPPYVFYEDAVGGTYIHSKADFEKRGLEPFSQMPMGTGPYKLKSLAPNSKAELEVNGAYWGTKPAWDSLVLLHAPEEATRIAMLKRGEADIAGVNWDNAISLRNEGFELRQTKASTVPGLFLPGYWMQPGPTSDVRVREAMDLAINRQELVDSFFKGFAKPAAGNFALTDLHYGFNPVWYSIKYEPDRAKQLLSAAGYPGNFRDPRIKIFSVAQVGWQQDFLQVISGYWEAVGIQTQLVPMDFTAMRSTWTAADPAIMGGVAPWIGVGSGAAGNQMPAQQNNMTSKGVNQAANDPELDALFFDMIAELDTQKRLDKWQVVQQKAFDLHTCLGVCRVFDQYAVSNKVGEWSGPTHLSNGFILGLPGVKRR